MATHFITQHRRATAEEWAKSGVVPHPGELVIEICDNNTFKTKLGDGVNTFPDLPYQNLDEEIAELKSYVDGKVVDGLLYEDNQLYLTLNGEIVSEPVEITGGGGGGGSSYSVRIINKMSSSTLSVAAADKVMLSALFYEYYGGVSTGVEGTLEVLYKLSSEQDWKTFSKQTISQDVVFNINVAGILTTGQVTDIKFVVTGGESNIERSLTYHITQVAASIETVNFNSAAVYTGNVNIQYKCTGLNLTKTVYFEIDGEIHDTVDVGTSHKTTLSYTIQMLGKYEYGAHDLRIYFKTSDGATSNILKYTLLYDDGAGTQPMVGAVCDTDEITYGDMLNIDYVVYTPKQETTDELIIKSYSIDDNGDQVIYERTVLVDVANNTIFRWQGASYATYGKTYVEFASGETIKTIAVFVNEMQTEYNLNPVTTSLVYRYSANGRNNNDAGKELYEYDYTTSNGVETVIEGQFDGFNWVSNGYIDGESLTLSGDARHTIAFPMFSTSYVDRDGQTINLESATGATVTTNGRTFEVEFKVSNVTDNEAHIIECMSSDHAGFVITPQNAYMLFANGANVKLDNTGFIENEEGIAATYIKDNARVRLSFVIEPRGSVKYTLEDGTKMSSQCLNIYVNGQYANSYVYPDNASFASMEYITMGSNTCILNLYDVRIYNRGLSEAEILQNYKASPLAIQDKLLRFEDNDVLNDEGDVDYYKAINKYPCLLITGQLSPYKGANGLKMEGKVESGVTLTKPDGQGGHTVEWDLLDKDLNGNWVSCNNVQGTSSQKFPRKNYKIYLVKVEYNEDGTPKTEEKDGVVKVKTKKVKYSLKGKDANGRDLSIGESTLCYKIDFMSSDHANTFNANLADTLFGDLTDAQKEDPRVQNTIYGFRCLLFRRDDVGAPIEFAGDGALNNDKGNTKTFGLECEGDDGNNTKRQKWEFLNNTESVCFFKTDRFQESIASEGKQVKRVKLGLESCYPDQGDLKDEGLEPNYDYLQVLFTWVCQRANFWDASTEIAETPYIYNGAEYATEREYRKAIFINEFERHFNLNHALVYYLFMEFTALCDNGAKNMFLRCEDVRAEHLVDIDGNEISINDIIEEGTGIVDANRIDWENSTFAIWLTDLYDLDSGYGVDNVGALQIPYYADWDYKLEDVYKFNGRESRLWLMIEEALADKIQSKAQELTAKQTGGLNYDALYDAHIKNNAMLVCPTIVNQDMEYKYHDPWMEGFVDYSMEGNPVRYISDYKYLQRGSRTEQKDAFIYKRSNMLYSKYQCSKFLNNNISFRVGTSGGVLAKDCKIAVTANQTLYPAIKYGDGDAAISSGKKISAGETVTISKFGTTDSDKIGTQEGVYIYGGTFLTDIGNLAQFRPYELRLQNAACLKRLLIGSNEEGYRNSQLTSLDTSACKLLEELNIMGCTALGPLNLSSNGLLKQVYASHSSVQSITLPNGGVLEELYLGDIVDLEIMNQANLKKFDCTSYDSLKRLRIENTPAVNTLEIVAARLPQLTGGLRLVGINETVEDMTVLNMLMSEDAIGKYIDMDGVHWEDITAHPYPYISGTVHIPTLTGTELQKIKECYPYLNITYDTLTANVIFMSEDGKQELYRTMVINGGECVDPVEAGIISMPTKESTAQHYYTWAGWSSTAGGSPEGGILDNIILDKVVYVAFVATVQTYTVRFYNGIELMQTLVIEYGNNAVYTGDTPIKSNTSVPELYRFTGWSPSSENIVEDTDCYAQFYFDTSNLYQFKLSDFEYATDDTNNTISITKYIGTSMVGTVPAAFHINGTEYKVISVDGFDETDVEMVILPDTIQTIDEEAFNNCDNLISINIPSSTKDIEAYAFAGCTQVTEINYNAINCNSDLSTTKRKFEDVGRDNGAILTIGANVTCIPSSMFYQSAFNLSKSVIRNLVFEDNSQCKTIGSRAFGNCNIGAMTLPNSLVSIDSYAFSNNSIMKSLIIPEGVTTLNANAFERWTNMINLEIPATVSKIGNSVFQGAESLESIVVHPDNKYFYSKDNCVINTNNKTLVVGCKNSIIPTDGSVTSFGYGSFQGCLDWEELIIPESIITIGSNAFANSNNLTNVLIPEGVVNINSMAFYDCNLTTVTIPNSVETLGMFSFGTCPRLQTVTIGSGIKSIHHQAFESSPNIKTIYVPWAEDDPRSEMAPWSASNATVVYNYKN